MLQSMTAFARKEHQGRNGSLTWEIKTINHRYLEVSVRLPESFSSLEQKIRDQLKKHLQRGKVEIILRYNSSASSPVKVQVNHMMVQGLLKAIETLSDEAKMLSSMTMSDLLRWPGVLQIENESVTLLLDELIEQFKYAVDELVECRKTEGESLGKFMLQRVQAIKEQLQLLEPKLPKLIQLQREKILARLQEYTTQVENNRLEQELVYFAQKMDVSEEVERLNVHLAELERCLKQGGVVGRRLDFLVQELHREANTLGAKLPDAELVQITVEIKVLIEQLREQAQNLE